MDGREELTWDERPGAWRALAAAVVTLGVAAGARLSFSAFFEPIERDTGLDRLTLSVAVAISAFAYGLAQPIAGRLAARYGARPVLMTGTALMAIGGFGVVFATRPWHFYLFVGLLPGLGFGSAGHVPGSVLLARWFTRHLGLAAGLMVSALPAGQAVFVPVSAALISSYGWRGAYIISGLLLACVALPVLWCWAGEPARPRPDRSAHAAGLHPRAGLDLWLIGIGTFGCGFADQFVAFHLVAFGSGLGITPVVAAGFLSLLMIAGIPGSIASGPLADRFRPPLLLAGIYLSRVLSVPLLLLVAPDRLWPLTVFGVLFGVTYIANQPPTARYVRDHYGVGAVGPVTGMISLAHQFGGAVGIAAGGLSIRLTGSYTAAIVTTIVLSLVMGLLQLLVTPRPVPDAVVQAERLPVS